MGRGICKGRGDEGNYTSMLLPLMVHEFHLGLASVPLWVLSPGQLTILGWWSIWKHVGKTLHCHNALGRLILCYLMGDG